MRASACDLGVLTQLGDVCTVRAGGAVTALPRPGTSEILQNHVPC